MGGRPRRVDIPGRRAPVLACRDLMSFSSSSWGMALPVRKCWDIRSSGSFSHTQFSSICDGASTKSRSTCVPLNMANSACGAERDCRNGGPCARLQ